MLMSIWYGSFALAAFSILLMIYLIIRRLITDAITRRRDARKENLKDVLFDLVNGQSDVKTAAAHFEGRDQRLLLEISGQLRRSLRGESQQRLVDLLNQVIAVDRLRADLQKGSAAEQAGLCAVLSWSESPDVHQALREKLDDPAPDVVLAAANALIDSGAGVSLHGLALKIVKHNMLGHKGVRDLFRKVAPGQSNELKRLIGINVKEIAVLAADAMARSDDMTVVAPLVEHAVNNPSVNVRAECFRSLGELRHPEGASAVLRGLTDPAWEVRTQAAVAAGRIGVQDAVPLLRQLLTDDHWWTQFRAAEALAKLGPAGREALMAGLANPISARVSELALADAKA